MKSEYSKIIPGAGPFYLEGSEVGLLMIHGGGGGTCADLKPLAEDLHTLREYTINVPLLPGFGTSPEDLRYAPISAWKDALENEIQLLNDNYKKIVVGGHSMGGLLTLILASQHDFDGIFTISAPAGIQNFLFKLVPIFKLLKKYHKIDSETFRKETNGAWIGYDKIPVNMGIKVKKLMIEMKKSLNKVKCPVLLLQGRLDSAIKKQSMDYIFERINSKNKKKILLKNNDHTILNCPDHRQIVSELIDFIDEICN